jgi:hypothetical protein
MFAQRGGHLLSGTFRSDDTVCVLAPQHSFHLLTGRLFMTNVMGEIRRNFTSPLLILPLYFPTSGSRERIGSLSWMCDEQPGAGFQTVPCDEGASFAERNTRMIDGLPLSFFLPLVVHALAALTTAVLGVITFSRPKRRGRHPKWGGRYLWAYTVVFLTAITLSVQHWPADAYLVVLATLGSGFALGGYAARSFRQEPLVRRVVGKQWVVAHIVGMIGSYTVLWTAFFVDNAHCDRASVPGGIPLPFRTEGRQVRATRSGIERRQMMARIAGISRGRTLVARLAFFLSRRSYGLVIAPARVYALSSGLLLAVGLMEEVQ